jgi:hypothetical protein
MSLAHPRMDMSPLDKEFIVRSERKVRLGPMNVDIRSNEENFAGMRYFPRPTQLSEESSVHYTLSLCNLGRDGPWPLELLRARQDNSYRSKRFLAGYYITDHFGSPAYLVTRGTHYWVFGTDFEPILWPYLVKLLLTLHSMDHSMLHLKAAGIVIDEGGTLLIARGGGGKTVLLTKLCQNGAQFLSNTHTLIDGHTAVGVATSMRVRNDALFAPIISTRRLTGGWKPGEYIADPCEDLGWQVAKAAPLRNICLVDYRGPNFDTVREGDPDVIYDYMEQFSLALNVYGLKEDMLDYLASEVISFSTHQRRMRSHLRSLVERCRRYYVSCDAMDPKRTAAIYAMLGGTRRQS